MYCQFHIFQFTKIKSTVSQQLIVFHPGFSHELIPLKRKSTQPGQQLSYLFGSLDTCAHTISFALQLIPVQGSCLTR